jgi:type I restriction enzyme R subunit
MPTEADTCRKFTVPALQQAGWEEDPHSIGEQRAITDGRIVPRGKGYVRRPPKRADYLLYYRRDFIIAVVEAKKEGTYGTSAMQQAKQYAEMLGLKFAYSTNGREIIEFDYFTGLETRLDRFPTPAELWQRYLQDMGLAAEPATAERLITPFHHEARRDPRYYQRLAIQRAVEAILSGRTRVLLTMATGTGKTMVSFQICWILWASKWNAKGDPTRKPRILFLADRNFLVNDPKDKTFAPFGDARHRIENGTAVFSREIYFSTYQSLARDERRPGLYKEFPRDFFDLVIVDECHRGSAKDSSSWREILEWFQPAYQLGMTATPLREENRDSYLYFGNPVYTYTLRQGIADGFLAPYRVHRIITQWDAAGWRPSKDDLDRYGRPIPDEEYHTADFERIVSLRARTQAIARHLTDHLKKPTASRKPSSSASIRNTPRKCAPRSTT